MLDRFVNWLLAVLKRERFEIGRKGDVYLTRWTLWGQRFGPGGKLFLHRFHRSDYEGGFHNHPWHFWSLILGPGYWEHTASGRHWYGPGRLLNRPASWRHRVEIRPGGWCWTLVWTGPKVQGWGFFCPAGFRPWRQHAEREAAVGDGCA
jgi:hypothetical protein